MSPHNLIPQVRSFKGLMSALTALKAMFLMRSEESEALSGTDQELANRIDAGQAELEAVELDEETLQLLAAFQELLVAMAKAAKAYMSASADAVDVTNAAFDRINQRHGGIAEAVASSPTKRAAKAEHYER